MDERLLPDALQVEEFKRLGYWIGPKLFDYAQVEQGCAHLERLRRREYEKGEAPLSNYRPSGDDERGLLKIDNGWWADRVMERFAVSPELGAIAARLLGAAEVYLWHDQVLFKPGKSGDAGSVGWHQDKGYWASSSTCDMVTAWVAFDDVDEENGCMRFVPGSHRWGLMRESDFFNADMEGQRRAFQPPPGERWSEMPVILARGQASFHHCLTLHGSGPNRSDRPRRSIAVHMMSGEARLVKGMGHDNERIFGGDDGQPFRGPRFPRLWPPAASLNQ